MKVFLEKDQMEQAYKKLGIQDGGDREKILSTWETKTVTEPIGSYSADIPEASSLKSKFPKPCNWQKN